MKDKTEIKEELKNDIRVKQVHDWFLDKDNRLVFEPNGYNDKKFSIKIELVNDLAENGWRILTFYDGFVEIKKMEYVERVEKFKEELNELTEEL